MVPSFIDYTKAFDCVDQNKLWEILQEMGIPDHLTCLLRNLYACQEATVRTRLKQQTVSKLGKEYVKAVFCHSAKCQAGGSTNWNQDYWEKYQWPQICRWHHPYGRKQRGTEEPLNKNERLNIQKTKITASSPITSWQIDGETMETVTDFIFLGSKITADGGCSHEIKRRLLLGRKVMNNLDSILESRDITLQTKLWFVI